MMFDKIIRAVRTICLSTLALAFTACVNEMDFAPHAEGGSLRLSLANISTATTRTSPHDLGKPSAEDFRLRILNASGRAVYDDLFTTEEITLPVGDYTVLATYGSNTLLALDQPYYVGQTTATVEKDKTAEASLTAKVGNALVSAIFGRDAEEQARFDRYYSDYALQVSSGTHSLRITKDNPAQSVYVQADNHVTLRFWGKLKMENDREVSCELTSENFPETLAAADHAIVTLSLPDPESALVADISKVEVETVTLDETIPLSWLPVPTVTPSLQIDRQGNIVGTKLAFSDGYPGMEWKAEVTKRNDTEVLRTIQGTGELTSNYSSSTEWPYLPQGQYTATYYVVINDKAVKASARNFSVPAPTGLEVTVTGYTSYDKYLEGDIEAANACDRLTIYEPTVSANVSPELLRNSHVTSAFSYTYDGETTDIASGINSYVINDITGQEVRSTFHVLKGDFTFDGVSVSSQKDFRITGLPYTLSLTNHEEWETSGGVDWFENDVRLGHLSTGSQYIQTRSAICIPPSTYFCADYSVNVHTLTVGTYLTISVGDIEIYRKDEDGTPFRDTDHLDAGTTAVFCSPSDYSNIIRFYNDYGAGQTCSHVYSFTLKYAAKP